MSKLIIEDYKYRINYTTKSGTKHTLTILKPNITSRIHSRINQEITNKATNTKLSKKTITNPEHKTSLEKQKWSNSKQRYNQKQNQNPSIYISKPKIYQSRVLTNVLELHIITVKKIKTQKYITKYDKISNKIKRQKMKLNLGTQ